MFQNKYKRRGLDQKKYRMALTDVLLTTLILLVIAILAYLKMTNKTLSDFIREIREIVKSEEEEIIHIR